MAGKAVDESTQNLWGIRLDHRWKAMWPKLHVCRVNKSGAIAENQLNKRLDMGFQPIEKLGITIKEEDQLMLCGGVDYQLLAMPIERWEAMQPKKPAPPAYEDVQIDDIDN